SALSLLSLHDALPILLGFIAWYLNRARGIGWMFVFFVALVVIMHYMLTRTKWGRSMYAVGGNVEAARRSGINVKFIYTSAFVARSEEHTSEPSHVKIS